MPLWINWISYILDIRLESTSSRYNEDLQLYLSKGRYQLRTPNAIYSFEDLYSNFGAAFRQLNLSFLKPENPILLLGFGLGSIVQLLENQTGKTFVFHAVEVDEEILYLAKKYTLPKMQSKIEFFCTDALAFLHHNKNQYQLICMDVFWDNVIPEAFDSEITLEDLHDTVMPGGVLLYNRLDKKNHNSPKERVFEKRFRTIFPKSDCIEVADNKIWVGRVV